ncbi:hypothetical protein PR048_029519 [Dryococelus australis]|uniref:Methyltransferase small domain-containing protein n=1 Tax=Dryococelus australis TaxID=614101 RepID=A0ABQ9GGB2_9NEOP|nr:hypothetical protein PR048_029519 [Dryococelus australis]
MQTPDYSHLTPEDFDHIYEPSEDTFLLLDALEEDVEFLEHLKPSLCLEVGSGSGVVVTALARLLGSSCSCLAVDINPVACEKTAATARKNGCCTEVVQCDLASALVKDRRVDVLVFNPPYVVTEVVSGPDMLSRAWAGGAHGRQVMDCLFPDVPHLLSEQGVFYLLVIMENKPLEIQEQMASLGFEMTILKDRKIRGEHLLVLKFTRYSC